MASQIASKNLYELLGNDPELDPDREPEPPTKVMDKPVQRAGKRNAGPEGPAPDSDRPRGGGRGGGHQVERRADLNGRPAANNRADQPRDDGLRQDRHPDRMRDPRQHREIGGRGAHSRGGRGTRGGRGRGDYASTRTARDDRHNHSGVGEHEKQAAHGWGQSGGEGEFADEKAGEAIAQAEASNEPGFVPDTDARDPAFTKGPDGVTTEEDAAPAEPEDKTKSYDDYLAEQAEKRLALSGNAQDIRKANEGSKQKFPEGTALARNPQEENFFAGAGGKNRKQKEVKEKSTLNLEGQYYAAPEQADRGGRGRGRGGGFRGDRGGRGGGDRGDRPERGERGDRGDRGERGDYRGGRGGNRGRGDRGELRGSRGGDRGGDRGGQRGGFNPQDESAFPSLGGA